MTHPIIPIPTDNCTLQTLCSSVTVDNIIQRHFMSSQSGCWGLTWHCVVGCVVSAVSKDHTATVFKVSPVRAAYALKVAAPSWICQTTEKHSSNKAASHSSWPWISNRYNWNLYSTTLKYGQKFIQLTLQWYFGKGLVSEVQTTLKDDIINTRNKTGRELLERIKAQLFETISVHRFMLLEIALWYTLIYRLNTLCWIRYLVPFIM